MAVLRPEDSMILILATRRVTVIASLPKAILEQFPTEVPTARSLAEVTP
jgi:hypothetical protein